MHARDARQRFRTDGLQTASPERLVVLLYERAVRDLRAAREAVVAGDHEIRHRNLLHAQEIVEELGYALQPEVWAGADGLQDLYDYVLGLVVRANVRPETAAIDEATAILDGLASAWRDAYVDLQQSEVPA